MDSQVQLWREHKQSTLNDWLTMGSSLGQIFGAMASQADRNNKKQFESAKRWAKAEAGLHAAVAAIKVWSGAGSFFSKAAQSVALAATLAAQITNIDRQQFSAPAPIGTFPADPGSGLPASNSSGQSGNVTNLTFVTSDGTFRVRVRGEIEEMIDSDGLNLVTESGERVMVA